MAKKSIIETSEVAEKATEEKKAEAVAEPTAEDLKARIAELEAKVREGEEGALKRVSKAMGLDPDKTAKSHLSVKEDVVEVQMGKLECEINGRKYTGTVKVPHSVAGVIYQAIGDRRMRLLREMTGNDYSAEMIGGAVRARKVGQINEHGEEV